jgi:hypothetical protein
MSPPSGRGDSGSGRLASRSEVHTHSDFKVSEIGTFPDRIAEARLHLAERAHNPRSKVLAEDPKCVRIGTARLRDLASLIEMFRPDLEGRHSDIVRAFVVKVGDRDTYIAARVMVRDIAHSLEPFRESPEFSS